MAHQTTPTCCTFARTHMGACYFTLTMAQQAHLVRLGAALAPSGMGAPLATYPSSLPAAAVALASSPYRASGLASAPHVHAGPMAHANTVHAYAVAATAQYRKAR